MFRAGEQDADARSRNQCNREPEGRCESNKQRQEAQKQREGDKGGNVKEKRK
jgi:hypothetical protein